MVMSIYIWQFSSVYVSLSLASAVSSAISFGNKCSPIKCAEVNILIMIFGPQRYSYYSTNWQRKILSVCRWGNYTPQKLKQSKSKSNVSTS